MQNCLLDGWMKCRSRCVVVSGASAHPRRVKPTVLVVRASSHGQLPEKQDAGDEPSTSYSTAARRAYAQLVAPSRVGAEYGEGFLQFRPGGEPRRLDVAALNEQLRPGGAIRMRFHLHPDEAYGTIFDFDSVVADTAGAYRRAWGAVAAARNLPLHPLARLAMHNTAPERIIMDVLGWTSSMKEARAIAFELAEAYAAELKQLGACTGPAALSAQPPPNVSSAVSNATLGSLDGGAVAGGGSLDEPPHVTAAGSAAEQGPVRGVVYEPQPGVREWLGALTAFNVPVALVSVLDRATVRRALERMHLHDHFRVLVTAEDELESTAQRYLSAALQMQRPPNMCAVFGATPESVTAAHNCTMKAVAVAASPDNPAYKLRSADVTVPSLANLTVYNLRRLFANAGDEFMDLRKQRSDDRPTGKRRVANAML